MLLNTLKIARFGVVQQVFNLWAFNACSSKAKPRKLYLCDGMFLDISIEHGRKTFLLVFDFFASFVPFTKVSNATVDKPL